MCLVMWHKYKIIYKNKFHTYNVHGLGHKYRHIYLEFIYSYSKGNGRGVRGRTSGETMILLIYNPLRSVYSEMA